MPVRNQENDLIYLLNYLPLVALPLLPPSLPPELLLEELLLEELLEFVDVRLELPEEDPPELLLLEEPLLKIFLSSLPTFRLGAL